MIEAAIFDLDGTLLDTIEDLADSVNYALRIFRLPELEYDEYKKFIGKGALSLCKASLKHSRAIYENNITSSENSGNVLKETKRVSYPDAEDILVIYRKKYEANIKNKTKPYAGIENELLLLQNAGILMSVISNKPENFTKDLIEEYFPEIKFQYIIGDSKLFPKKPNPESLQYVIDKTGADHSRTAYIGDSEIDMLTASAAKVIPVGVLWGFRNKETLEKAGAKILIKEVKDLYQDLIGRRKI